MECGLREAPTTAIERGRRMASRRGSAGDIADDLLHDAGAIEHVFDRDALVVAVLPVLLLLVQHVWLEAVRLAPQRAKHGALGPSRQHRRREDRLRMMPRPGPI